MKQVKQEVIDFDKLSQAEQRVAIAKDVISNVLSHKYRAKNR